MNWPGKLVTPIIINLHANGFFPFGPQEMHSKTSRANGSPQIHPPTTFSIREFNV